MTEFEEYLSHDKLTCLECGNEYSGLFRHIERVHDIPAKEYALKYGLPLSCGFVGKKVRNKLIENGKKRWVKDKENMLKQLEKAHETDRKPAPPNQCQAITAMRQEIIQLAIASPKHLRHLKGIPQTVPCSDCGGDVQTTVIGAMTHACDILCFTCRYQHWKISKGNYLARNPHKQHEWTKAYLERQKRKAQSNLDDRKKEE